MLRAVGQRVSPLLLLVYADAGQAGRLSYDQAIFLESDSAVWQRRSMKSDDLRELLRATPFQPFTIRMGSNKSYRIPHSEFAALSPDGEMLVVFLPKGGGFNAVDVRLIETLEVRKQPMKRS